MRTDALWERALTSLHHAVHLRDRERAAYALSKLRELNEREADVVVAREMASLDAELLVDDIGEE